MCRQLQDADDSDQEETVKYGELEYWEERYGGWAQSPYDWLFEWKHVRHVCKEFLQTTDLIMQPGCGNAPFSAHMYEDGYENQINIDTSTEAIKKMLELHSESCPKAEWLIKDATATGAPIALSAMPPPPPALPAGTSWRWTCTVRGMPKSFSSSMALRAGSSPGGCGK